MEVLGIHTVLKNPNQKSINHHIRYVRGRNNEYFDVCVCVRESLSDDLWGDVMSKLWIKSMERKESFISCQYSDKSLALHGMFV